MNINKIYENIFNYNSYTDIAPESEKNMVLRLTNITPNDISLLFFRDDNINKLNKRLINEVLRITKDKYNKPMKIQSQKKEQMLTLMRYIYFRYNTNTQETLVEVEYLNNKFIEDFLDTAINSLLYQIKYIENYNRSEQIPLARPISTYKKADLKPFSSLFGF
jgi:hypothetical protein